MPAHKAGILYLQWDLLQWKSCLSLLRKAVFKGHTPMLSFDYSNGIP
jgi:hypothetical protein